MRVIVHEPLLDGRELGWPWAYHALLVEESDEMAETLGRFRELAGPVAREPGDIALYEVAIYLADGIALLL